MVSETLAYFNRVSHRMCFPEWLCTAQANQKLRMLYQTITVVSMPFKPQYSSVNTLLIGGWITCNMVVSPQMDYAKET